MPSNKLATAAYSSNALYLRRVKNLDLGKKRDAPVTLDTSSPYLFRLSFNVRRFSLRRPLSSGGYFFGVDVQGESISAKAWPNTLSCNSSIALRVLPLHSF